MFNGFLYSRENIRLYSDAKHKQEKTTNAETLKRVYAVNKQQV